MNKFIISTSFLFVLLLHLILLIYFKTSKIEVSQEENKPISLQINKLEMKNENSEIQKEEIIVEKKIEKPISKPTPVKQTEKSKPIIKKENIETTPSVKETVIENKKEETNKSTENTEIQSSNEKLLKESEFINKYKSELREEINKNKTYPTISRKLKEQGKVIVNFRVLKNGLFENISVNTSSNIKRLDDAALNALFETKKFKPFENEINKEYLDFELALEFLTIN